MALGALIGVLLAVENYHRVAEALAGWVTGAAISLGAIRMAGALPSSHARAHGLLCSMLVFASVAWLAHAVPHGYLIVPHRCIDIGNLTPSAADWSASACSTK